MHLIYMVKKSLEMSTDYGFLKSFFLCIFISAVPAPSSLLETVRFGVADDFSDILSNFHANKSHFADVCKVTL